MNFVRLRWQINLLLIKLLISSLTSPEESLRVNDYDTVYGIHGRPNPHGARLLVGGGLEHLSSEEKRVIQRVGFALPCIPKDGDHLEKFLRPAA